jgi:hypothetical protein
MSLAGRVRTALDMLRDEEFRLLMPEDEHGAIKRPSSDWHLSPAILCQDHDTTGYPVRDDVRQELSKLIRAGTLRRMPEDEWRAAGLPGDFYSVYKLPTADNRTSPPNGSNQSNSNTGKPKDER